jgi:hypothetical protein
VTRAAKTVRKQGRPFKKGKSGNPSGRPQGSRNKATLAMEKLLDGEADRLTQKAVDLAMEGDTTALRLCLERLCPPRKDRPVSFDLPSMETPADAVAAMSALLAAVAQGEVTPGEAQTIAAVIEVQRRVIESEDHERRLRALEHPAEVKR